MPPPLRKRAASPTDINKHTARAFPMNGKPPGHGSPERNGAVARQCRSGVFRPLPITPMLMCLYGVVSVEDMAAASPRAVRLVSVGKKRCPATDFHRAASTGISSLPPSVGFGAPLSTVSEVDS